MNAKCPECGKVVELSDGRLTAHDAPDGSYCAASFEEPKKEESCTGMRSQPSLTS